MDDYVRYITRLLRVTSILLLLSSHSVFSQTTQEHVHQMAHHVMPFKMSNTLHIFKMTESGGIQKVIVKNTDDIKQVALIQQHLKHEAEKFQHGDYSDPARLHGSNMPGLDELQTGASSIKVLYASIPAGAQITFETTNIQLLTAIHRWFGAQLSEHGADAKAE